MSADRPLDSARGGGGESEVRSAEINLMLGRVSVLASTRGLRPRERIGVCLVEEMLQHRLAEIEAAIERRRSGA